MAAGTLLLGGVLLGGLVGGAIGALVGSSASPRGRRV
jgi:hypothetical protein